MPKRRVGCTINTFIVYSPRFVFLPQLSATKSLELCPVGWTNTLLQRRVSILPRNCGVGGSLLLHRLSLRFTTRLRWAHISILRRRKIYATPFINQGPLHGVANEWKFMRNRSLACQDDAFIHCSCTVAAKWFILCRHWFDFLWHFPTALRMEICRNLRTGLLDTLPFGGRMHEAPIACLL